MKLVQETSWIGDLDFKAANPQIARVTGFSISSDDKGRSQKELSMQMQTGKARKMGIYTDSLNELIKAFGEETDLWIGKQVSILLVKTTDGKNKRILTPILSNE